MVRTGRPRKETLRSREIEESPTVDQSSPLQNHAAQHLCNDQAREIGELFCYSLKLCVYLCCSESEKRGSWKIEETFGSERRNPK